MQTLHTVLKRGLLTWDRGPLSESLFRERLARVQETIAALGHDAWLVYGDALRYGDVAYISHFVPRTRGALVLVPRVGEPALLVSVGPRDIPAAKTLTWIEDVRPFVRLPREVIRLLAERGLARGRIGIVGVDASLSLGEWEEIRAGVPDMRWEPADEAFAPFRARKEPAERAVMRAAGRIVHAGLERARDRLCPGISERELTALVDRELRYAGAEDTRFLVASGERAGLGLRPPDDRHLARGDLVLHHVAVEYQRYWAEAGQTYSLGRARTEAETLAKAARDAVAAMATGARPGVTVGTLAEHALPVLRAIGGGESARAYGLGHGIGLDLEEPPCVRPGEEAGVVDESTLALHVVVATGRGPGALAGQTILVGGGGAEPLTGEVQPLLECG